MTTETRSVAEIMGWRSRGGYGCEYWWWDANGKAHETVGPDPTPDDLLTWLDEQGYDVRPPYDNAITGRPVHLIVTATHRAKRDSRKWFEEEVEAPTLHAALEAAVRAVAGEVGE